MSSTMFVPYTCYLIFITNNFGEPIIQIDSLSMGLLSGGNELNLRTCSLTY